MTSELASGAKDLASCVDDFGLAAPAGRHERRGVPVIVHRRSADHGIDAVARNRGPELHEPDLCVRPFPDLVVNLAPLLQIVGREHFRIVALISKPAFERVEIILTNETVHRSSGPTVA